MASTCSPCDVPMPNANAPSAPWVAVWLSLQTRIIPGWVSPQLRPDHVHDSLVDVADGIKANAGFLAVAPEGVDLRPREHVGDGTVDFDRRHVCGLRRRP